MRLHLALCVYVCACVVVLWQREFVVPGGMLVKADP